MIVRFVPVEKWPGEPRKDQAIMSSFSATWANTLQLLEYELERLGARAVIIQGYFRADQIRLDGWPKGEAQPSRPGVVVTFQTPKSKTELSFPCDTFDLWQDNLRAIALALEALRKVDRYGVTKQNEQYTGWAKLPPAPEPGKMKPEDACTFIGLHSDTRGYAITAGNFKECYRRAAGRLHPDNKQTGNEHLFTLLADAKRSIEDAYGWRA